MGKLDFYDLIDVYAQLHDMDMSDALDLWYRGGIDAADLLAADLENEGILGYCDHLIDVIKALRLRSKLDGKGDPWISDITTAERSN